MKKPKYEYRHAICHIEADLRLFKPKLQSIILRFVVDLLYNKLYTKCILSVFCSVAIVTSLIAKSKIYYSYDALCNRAKHIPESLIHHKLFDHVLMHYAALHQELQNFHS